MKRIPPSSDDRGLSLRHAVAIAGSKRSNATTQVIPRGNFNDSYPMWIGDKVYFVSDRAGTENLFSFDTVRKTIAQLTHFEKYGVKSASTNGESIVFNRGGALHLFNLQTNQATPIAVPVTRFISRSNLCVYVILWFKH